jgi:hypothetical protein
MNIKPMDIKCGLYIVSQSVDVVLLDEIISDCSILWSSFQAVSIFLFSKIMYHVCGISMKLYVFLLDRVQHLLNNKYLHIIFHFYAWFLVFCSLIQHFFM